MNRYVAKMGKAATAYLDTNRDIASKLEKLNVINSEGILSPNDFIEQRDTLKKQEAELQNNYLNELESIYKDYSDAVKEWGRPKGEEITPDSALLSSSIDLSQDELNELASRYYDNATMTRLIVDYAKSRYESVEQVILHGPTSDMKNEAMMLIKDFMSRIAPRTYEGMLFETEGAFEDLLRDSGWGKIIGDSSEL